MQRERITDHITVFRSDLYAQVTAGLALTDDGAVLIDTLLYPEETRRIRRYVESGLGEQVRLVINTHYHADHTSGNCFFPGAEIIAHARCRELLDGRGRDSLRRMRAASADFNGVEIALPTRAFDKTLSLDFGGCRFDLRHSPGHSPDSITCLVDNDTLFAGDTLMPLPYFVDGDMAQLEKSLPALLECEFEHLVQGHGEIVLRGEAQSRIHSDLEYLRRLSDGVREGLQRGEHDIEERLTLEDCGKSYDLLHGIVAQLHKQNIQSLVGRLTSATLYGDEFEDKQAWIQRQII